MKIELTKQEQKRIKNALRFVYDAKIKIVKDNSKIFSEKDREMIFLDANKCFDLSNKFINK